MGIQPFLFSVFLLLLHSTAAAPVGICYGIVANNLPPASNVVNLLKSNGISNIRLFNADPDTLKPFSGTGIQLMIGVPNEVLLLWQPAPSMSRWTGFNPTFSHMFPPIKSGTSPSATRSSLRIRSTLPTYFLPSSASTKLSKS
ncbi:Glucan endo-1,3-beta-glucosidase GIV [Vitis vinifera]|uniref:glucan endo-1,3-beta-D-glucosidase n=1 Tax=Vitis vinifera TaxID=29760 RepID=A0A438JNB0_VITVI|nr:Glucan endo-1,3-beta-glucosidase GIV [Vitis vinifera]